MKPYLVLLRGINVGGKNKVNMAALRNRLEKLGFSSVSTFIASGNVLLKSDKKAEDIKDMIERDLVAGFKLDSDLIKVLVLTPRQLQAVIDTKPKGFGDTPAKYHSDTIFLMDIDPKKAMAVFNPREGVDRVWPGKGVIYSERLSAKRTQSRLSKIVASPLYKSMTIRNWNTTTKLLELIKNMK